MKSGLREMVFLLAAQCAFGGEKDMTTPSYDPPSIISAWCGPEAKLDRYKEYADSGFNVVLGGRREHAKGGRHGWWGCRKETW